MHRMSKKIRPESTTKKQVLLSLKARSAVCGEETSKAEWRKE